MKSYYKITIILLISLTLSLFNGCEGSGDKEFDCLECVDAQVALCEEYGSSNCKSTTKTEKAKQRVIDNCPGGVEKAKYILLLCWRADASPCSSHSYTCE